jgi:hypothetical protein
MKKEAGIRNRKIRQYIRFLGRPDLVSATDITTGPVMGK